MLDRMLQLSQTHGATGVARHRAVAVGTAACFAGTGTGSGVEQVTANAYVINNKLVARLAASWSAIARKSMVPVFHDRWPLCPT